MEWMLMPALKLGKSHPRVDARTLQAASFITLPTRPKSVSYGTRLSWPMYANDQYGDCTIAAKWHMIEAWARGLKTTDAKVVSEYLRLSGGADSGLVMLDVLNDWRKAKAHWIHAYAQVKTNREAIAEAVYLFGGVYLGVALPAYLEHRMDDSGNWSWTLPTSDDAGSDAPGSWGGHAVNIAGYSSTGCGVITWGRRVHCSWRFLERYADEAYACVSPDWFAKTGRDRHGFNQAQLDADLVAI